MARGRSCSAPAAYAALTGIALIGWWAATFGGAMPAAFRPVQRQTWHVVAELALAGALLVGAWLDVRGSRSGRLVLSAALGALLYAAVNVIGDFPQSPLMTTLVAGTVVLSLAMLIMALLGYRSTSDDVSPPRVA